MEWREWSAPGFQNNIAPEVDRRLARGRAGRIGTAGRPPAPMPPGVAPPGLASPRNGTRFAGRTARFRRFEMVIVFGSINVDITVNLTRLPERGETVLGHGCVISPGGKGANQAHAARRAGAAVAMVGKVGADPFAAPALARLRAEGVDLARVEETDEPTGCATIWVEEGTGASTIAVASGANRRVNHSQLPDERLDGEPILLLQHEVPLEENLRLVERAARRGCRILLNAAPAFPVPDEVLAALDVLIVNEVEIVQIAAHAGGGDEPLRSLPEWLARRFGLTVAATFGAEGSLCHTGREAIHTPALAIRPVDTTGAGDTYAGVLAASLAAGHDLRGAARLASAAGSLACARAGAQSSQPARAEIEAAAASLPSPRG